MGRQPEALLQRRQRQPLPLVGLLEPSQHRLVTGQPAAHVERLDHQASGGITVAATNSSAFFRIAQAQYAEPTLAPPSIIGRTVTLNLRRSLDNADLGTITAVFSGAKTGTYNYNKGNPANGTIVNYEWTQEPYVGRIWPIEYSNLVAMTLRLNFESTNGGTVSGTAYSASPFAITGTFIMTAQ